MLYDNLILDMYGTLQSLTGTSFGGGLGHYKGTDVVSVKHREFLFTESAVWYLKRRSLAMLRGIVMLDAISSAVVCM